MRRRRRLPSKPPHEALERLWVAEDLDGDAPSVVADAAEESLGAGQTVDGGAFRRPGRCHGE